MTSPSSSPSSSFRFLRWFVVIVIVALFATTAIRSDAFVTPTTRTPTRTTSSTTSNVQELKKHQDEYLRSSSTKLHANLVVVSPPGGVGEVAAVKAACAGSNVRWFVVEMTGGDGGDDSSVSVGGVSLSPQTLQDISRANGSLELAGATADELQQGSDALVAVATWCGSAGPVNGLISTYDDGILNSGVLSERQQVKSRSPVKLQELAAAIRLASKEVAKDVSGPRVAVLAAEDEILADFDKGSDDDAEGGGLLGSLFGKSVSVPPTLAKAVAPSSSTSNNKLCIVRHGELFGLPESSPDFSPLVGGPKKQPVVTEEYMMRSVRVDPFVVSGNVMSASSTSRTCRHCLGEAAALFASGKVPILSQPVSISSQVGTDIFSIDQWQQEVERVQDLIESGQASTLFSQEMIVDDTERLADWLATKWAPAVLRTYDIAAIRIGARPVYATRPGGDDQSGVVEITWQELIKFDSVTVGKMILQVNADGIRATRGPGDSSKGYGNISPMPLPGEDVLVRRLAEAASQAVEKGLAKKAPTKKQAKAGSSTPTPVTSLQASGDVVDQQTALSTSAATATATKEPPKQAPSQTGPRQAGARRSTPRSRGSNKKSNE